MLNRCDEYRFIKEVRISRVSSVEQSSMNSISYVIRNPSQISTIRATLSRRGSASLRQAMTRLRLGLRSGIGRPAARRLRAWLPSNFEHREVVVDESDGQVLGSVSIAASIGTVSVAGPPWNDEKPATVPLER